MGHMVQTRPPRVAGAASRAHRHTFTGLFPQRLLRWRRPMWWQELAIIALGYWLYTMGRNAIPEQASIAVRHGLSIEHVQQILRLNFELSINRWVAAHEWVAQVLDYYYATLHFVITIGVMVWLFVQRPHVYRGARTVLFTTTLIALAGFALCPVAPPRLLPHAGYIDTVIRFHTWGSLADPEIAAHSNQYAAMPSLHVGWDLLVGLAIFAATTNIALRVLACLMPLAMAYAVVATANHFVLDVVAGVVLVLIGHLVALRLAAWRARRQERG